MEALTETIEDLSWIAAEDAGTAGRLSRAAADVGRRLGFSDRRVAEITIAATELATNLHRHAVAGAALLRVRRTGAEAAVEVLAFDRGPGMADVAAAARDGFSTRGTLGVGIGAVMRLASSYDTHSVVGKGTVTAATFGPTAAPQASPGVDGLTRAITGEMACGDAWSVRSERERTALLLVDGLGHGELAATASRAAVRAFEDAPMRSATQLLSTIDGALRPTRGAAAAVAMLDRGTAHVSFSGIGNIGAWIDDGEKRKGMPSSPGIAGAFGKPIRELRFALPASALVVLHSDGLTSKWDLNAYPGLRARRCLLIAATLLRDAGVHHDDASAVVARAS